MNTSAIVAEILKGYTLHPRGFHGVVHWARVMENGLKLAETTGADPTIVTLFALFHDSRRVSDGRDWGHGRRGGQLARKLCGRVFDLSDEDGEVLFHACALHTEGTTDPNPTVQTCWDADRLDLGRVGIRPDPRYLCTDAARSPTMIAWAHRRACTDHEPAIVLDEWRIPLDI
ncbi:MAG: hypothetical protein LC104_13790 [Bacteroidales bacterium]|nr:hypothetical protein [Bacteroidales bacterium]